MKLLTQIEQETTSQWFIDELATAALDVTERPAQTALVERTAPHHFVAQETVRLSRLPTVVDGRVEPRHVDLRVFSLGSGRRTVVMPAPLTRVALRSGSMIVNSSQGGGAKDTWIISGD